MLLQLLWHAVPYRSSCAGLTAGCCSPCCSFAYGFAAGLAGGSVHHLDGRKLLCAAGTFFAVLAEDGKVRERLSCAAQPRSSAYIIHTRSSGCRPAQKPPQQPCMCITRLPAYVIACAPPACRPHTQASFMPASPGTRTIRGLALSPNRSHLAAVEQLQEGGEHQPQVAVTLAVLLLLHTCGMQC